MAHLLQHVVPRKTKRFAPWALLLAVPIGTIAVLLLAWEQPLGSSRLGAAGQELAPRFQGTADHVHILTVGRLDTIKGDEIVVTLNIDHGYHINANPASFDYLIPTRLNFSGLEPISIAYPRPTHFQPKFADMPLDVFEGTVAITALLPKGTARGSAPSLSLRATLTAQACDAVICLPPADLTIGAPPASRDETTLQQR
ncbi:MAG: protein-disulfide reductase DsbD family protein [Magnetospirillum sp.]|nr:protein-disulfide reductase DsbD family protein [Magnetospirillum sp.]